MRDDPADPSAQVRTALRRDRGRGVVVAVSGGSDSVALLRLLDGVREEMALRLSVAHLDHGTRGDQAKADAAFVAGLAQTLGLPFDLGHWRPTREGHFEADARAARYAWLVDVAKTRGAALVAVGHTRDDQAETVLHRILRGTGPKGLAGIPSRRKLAEGVNLVRPLLDVSRKSLRLYLAAIGQGFREDATNADLGRTRNRIRHDLLPKLAAEYNPRVVEALARLGSLAAESGRAWGRHLDAIGRRVVVEEEDSWGITLDRKALRALSPVVRAEVIRAAWRRRGWPERSMDAARWRELARLAPRVEGWFRVAGTEIRCVGAGPYVQLIPRFSPTLPATMTLDVPGSTPYAHGHVIAHLAPTAPADERIDLDRVVPPLTVGPFRYDSGERFDPLGMGGHTQTISDFLRGRRVSGIDRSRVPLVRDQEGVVWVVGHRIAHRVRLTEATRTPLSLRWETGTA